MRRASGSERGERRPTRRTVLARVLGLYVVVTLAFASVAGYAAWGQHSSVGALERTRGGYLPFALALRDAVASQNTYNSQLNYITEARNPADKEAWFASALSVGRPRVFQQIRVALRRAFDDSEPSRVELGREVASIEEFLAGDEAALLQLFDMLGRDEIGQAEVLRDELVTRGTQALIRLRNLEERVTLQLDTLMAEAVRHERSSLQILLTWGAFTVLFGGSLALYTRQLLRPLVAVTQRANAVARGDFTPRDVVAGNDEIGELARTFESMVAAIAKANRELVEAERLAAIGKMAAQVTHELRNPLSSINLNIELLEEELAVASPEAHELCAAIQRELERLTELTEQYLSVARRNDPDLRAEDLSLVGQEAAAFVRREFEASGVNLECDFATGSLDVQVDERQLRQVIHNLLRNARQAMPSGGTAVLGTRREGANALLFVADEGGGLSASAREHLFEPFFSTKKGGTGLGLAISRQIVEAHGGTIACRAREPRGVVFELRLPLQGT